MNEELKKEIEQMTKEAEKSLKSQIDVKVMEYEIEEMKQKREVDEKEIRRLEDKKLNKQALMSIVSMPMWKREMLTSQVLTKYEELHDEIGVCGRMPIYPTKKEVADYIEDQDKEWEEMTKND